MIDQQQAVSSARAIGEAVGQKVEEVADRSKMAGAESVGHAARTVHTIADQVEAESPAVANYVRSAAGKIEQLADDLREKNVGELLGSAAEFGRSQPVVMLAGAALVGFALSRLVKAGVSVAATGEANDGGSDAAATRKPATEYDPMKDLS